MAKVRGSLMAQAVDVAVARARKMHRETKPYRIEATITGRIEISLRAKNKQGASKAGRKDLLTPNPRPDYLELEKVKIIKITEETESPSKWLSPKELGITD